MDITPSSRKSSAQRMLSATTLSCEGFVALFAGLVAHGLAPETRAWSWGLSLTLLMAFLVLAGRLGKGGTRAYWAGFALQVPLIAFGVFIPAMYVIGLGFAVMYALGVVKGHALDAEKDAIDARVLGEANEPR